ncbi:MAG TPA: Crp/Fnr family transcriptional regulator [Chitinophagales bacterium]|nr:Crp/Fnr family transcriptional regulator [Chitinophagales bacterium]
MIDTDLLLQYGATERKASKDETILFEGDEAHFYYQIVSGSVKMINTNDDGKEFIQGIFDAGQGFGEPPLFDDGVYPASAVAMNNCVMLRLGKEKFLELLKSNSDVHFHFTRKLALRLRNKAVMLSEVSSHNPEHRIITLIDQLRNASNKKEKRFMVNVTRQQIANMTGLRVETVIRAVRAMHTKGSVQIERGKIYLP